MTRARLLDRPLDRAQSLPATLDTDRGKPELAGHPARHFATRPQPAIGRRIDQADAQALQQVRLEQARRAPIVPAQVAQGRKALGIVAGAQLLDPARHEAGHRRDFRARVPLRQKPDHLNVPGQDRILRGPEPLFQLSDAQMLRNPRHDPHPPRTMAKT